MSTLKADTIVASDGTSPATLTKQTAAKAFFEYTSVTSTALAGSFNISGVVDNGPGDTSLSFTNNMSSSVYVAAASDVSYNTAYNGSLGHYVESTQTSKQKTSSTFTVVYTAHSGTSVLDHCENMGTVHGDLA
jgi:hypothetical protein